MRTSLPHVISIDEDNRFIVGGVVSLTTSVVSHPSLHAVSNSADVIGSKVLITIHVPIKTFLTASFVFFTNLLYLFVLVVSLELIEFNLSVMRNV
jgi:hypothetical protein